VEDQNQKTSVIFPDDGSLSAQSSFGAGQDSVNSLSSQPTPLQPQNMLTPLPKKPENFLVRLVKRADVVLALLLVLGSFGLVVNAVLSSGKDKQEGNSAASQFDTTQIPLEELITGGGIDFGSQSVTINGALLLNDAFVLSPSQQPTSAVAGQMYYDQTSNVLAYYNGTQFVPVTGSAAAAIQSAGAGLTLTGTQISNTGVLSIQGQTGDVTLTAGNGIGVSGTTISNTGVVNLISTDSTLVVTNDGSGNYELTVNLGGAGVTSLNGLAGILTLANASGAGSTVTIDDASTAAKGIAQFNPANFSAAGGIVNTIQNIGAGATPTFAGVNTNNITPSGALTVGSTAQQLTLQGNASTQLTATSGGFATTLGFTGVPIGNVTYNLDRSVAAGTYTLCSTVGNCAGSGSGVTSAGGGAINRLAKFTASQNIENSTITDDGTNVTTSADIVIQGGDLTVGVPSSQTGTINLAHSGSAFLGSFVQGALTDNRSYLLPDTGGTVCISTGNCNGAGSPATLQAAYDAGNTVTTSDNRSLIFTLSDSATDSNFLVNLECDTACAGNGRFAIQDDGADIVTVVPASMTLGTNVDLFLQGASAFVSNPQGQSASESFGLNATVTGANAIAMGNGATAALDSVAIGQGAAAVSSGVSIGQAAGVFSGAFGGPVAIGDGANASSWGVAIGSGTSTSGNGGTAVGQGATTTGQLAVALGNDASAAQQSIALGAEATTAGNNQIAIGYSATTTADNQLVIGGSTTDASYINQAYLGSGVTDATPQSITLQATGGLGTDIAGANFTLAGGRGTGSANGGNINFQISAAGGSGATLNALTTVATLQGGTGAANFINVVDSTSAFNVEENGGGNLLTVDTVNSRVGINLGANNTPTLASGTQGLEVQGALRISGTGSTGWDNYTTPVGSSVLAKVNIVNQTMNPFGQIMALGLTSGSSDSARGLSIFDARTVAHQPTLAVFAPDENSMVGFTWNGSNSAATVQTNDQASGSSDSLVLQSGNATGNGVGSGNVLVTSGSVQGGTGGGTGTLTLQSGNGAGTDSSSGNLVIDSGAKTGAGTTGTIIIGGTNASALTLGRTGLTTNNAGSLTLGQLGTTDTSAFLCRNSSNILAACSGAGTGAAFVQGGNSFAATAILGTSDANILNIITGGTTRMSFGATGGVSINRNDSADELELGDNIFDLNDNNTRLNIGNTANNSIIRLGESSTNHGFLTWSNTDNVLRMGTNSTHALEFSTNNTVRANITSSGSLQVPKNPVADEVDIGDDLISANDTVVRLNVMNSSDSAFARFGQASTQYMSVGWNYNSTAANAFGSVSTTDNTQHLSLQSNSTAGVVIGSATEPGAGVKLLVDGGTMQINNLGTTNTAAFLCRNGSNVLAACNTTGDGAAFVQGGNSFTATAVLGTNDAFDLQFERGGITQLTVGNGNVTLASNVDLSLQGATAYISNTQGQSSSEAFGNGATVGSTSALAVGNNATATGQFSTAVGDGTAAGFASTALGRGADASGQQATALGANASATFLGSIAIGEGATATAVNQLVIGNTSADGSDISQAYIGSGVTDITPTSVTIQGTGGSGANVAGASLTLAAGKSTGSANGGGLNFQISAPGGAGSSLNSLSTVASLSGVNGAATFQNATNSANAFRILNAAGTGEHLGLDTTDSILRLLANNTGHLSGTGANWNTGTSLPSPARCCIGAVSVNGYLYSIGGDDGGGKLTTVAYTRINSDGSVGTWGTTTALPVGLAGGGNATSYNGYIYVTGGASTANDAKDIFYAKPNSDGTITSWTRQDDPTGNIDHQNAGLVAYNGYLYITGGSQISGTLVDDVYYAKIQADGSVPTFSVMTDWIPTADSNPGQALVANGYLYVMGSANYNKFYYGRILPDGTAVNASSTVIGTLATGTTDERKYGAIAAMNGYLYAIGGSTSGLDTIQYAPIGNDGDLGTFVTDTTTLPAARTICPARAPVVNNYIYLYGCGDGDFNPTTSVYYASGSRVKVGGGLDLVGYSGETMSDGGTGGQLTAGNTYVNGTLSVTGNAEFKDGAGVSGAFNVSGSQAIKTVSNTNNAFTILNSAGNQLLNVGTVHNPNDVVTNGSIETNTTGWAAKGAATIARTTAQQYVGLASLSTTTTAAVGDGAQYNITLSSSTQYTASFYAKLDSGTFTNMSFGYSSDGVAETDCKTNNQVKTGGWHSFNCTFTTGTVSGTPYFYWEQAGATARTVYVDALQIVPGADIGAYYDGKINTGGLAFSGPVAIQNDNDSNSALQVQGADGTTAFGVDTLNNRVGVNLISATATFHVVSIGSGDVTALFNQHTSSTDDILQLQKASATTVSVTHEGLTTFQNLTNSATSFRILRSNATFGSGTPLFVVDTTDSRVYIGNPSSDTTGALLILDDKSSAGDPSTTGVTSGAMYYNSNAGKIRCFENSAWKNCLGMNESLTFNGTNGNGTASNWANMPAALTELWGLNDSRLRYDLTDATEARLQVNVAGAGVSGSQLRIQYSTDQSTWNYLDGGTGPASAVDAGGISISSWVTITAGAKSDVYLRVIGINGDGATAVQFGLIQLQVR